MNKKEFIAFLKKAEVKTGGSITVVVDFIDGFKFKTSVKSKSSKAEIDGGKKKTTTKKPTKKRTTAKK